MRLTASCFTLFIALIVVSGTLTTYVYLQSRHAGQDLAQAELVIQNLKKNEAGINAFANPWVAYGQQHPDFAPVLKKYGLPPAAAPKK